MTNHIEPVKVNGISIFPFQSRQLLLQQIESKRGILVAVNAEKILHATSQTRDIVNRNIGYADGLGAVWALRKKGYKAVKIPGCEFWLDLINRYEKEKSFYLVGGKQEVIEKVVNKLQDEHPHINLLGYRNGYLKTENEKTQLLEEIEKLKPDVVFVAMGSPKQELLMEEMQKNNPNAIYQGLGGSFDVYIGKVKRAPDFWVKHGLEWAYRWLKEPKARTKRNLQLFRFFYKLYTNQLK